MLDFLVTDLVSTGNMRAGCRPDGAHVVMTGGYYAGNANGGIVPVSTTTVDLTITGAVCINNTGDELADGIRVVGVTDVSISNVHLRGNDGSGLMLLNGAKNITVSGGVFRDNGKNVAARAATSGRDGITIKGTGCEDITIDGAICIDQQGVQTQEYGIAIEGDANWVTIGGNCNIHGSAQTILNTSTGTSNKILHGIAGLPHDATLRASVSVTGTTAETNLISQTMPGEHFRRARPHAHPRGRDSSPAPPAARPSGSAWARSAASSSRARPSPPTRWSGASWRRSWPRPRTAPALHLIGYEGGAVGPTIQTQHVSSPTIDWRAAQDVRVTGQLGSAGDSITQTFMSFEVLGVTW